MPNSSTDMFARSATKVILHYGIMNQLLKTQFQWNVARGNTKPYKTKKVQNLNTSEECIMQTYS